MTGDPPPPSAVFDLPELSNPTVSPDGHRVATYRTGDGRTEICVVDLRTGSVDRWTDGGAGATSIWPLAWTADGTGVLFHRDRSDGAERYDLHVVTRDEDPKPVFRTDGSTQLRDVGPAGRRLLLRSDHEGGMDTYLYDRGSDELTRLTDRDGPVYRPRLGPDGERVAYPADDELVLCDATGSVQRRWSPGAGSSTSIPVDWHEDGRHILVSHDGVGVDRAGVLDTETGAVTWFGDATHVEAPECFLPDGGVLVVRKRDARDVPVVYEHAVDDAASEGRELAVPEGSVCLPRNARVVVDERRVLLPHATPTRPTRLLVYDLVDDEYEVALDADRGPYDGDALVSPIYSRVRSDGVPRTQQAAVAQEPSDEFDVGTLFWDPGERPSPLVVLLHGGPHQSDRLTFRPRVQYLCRRGYAVLQVNFRGSTGRGRRFRTALHGDWGGAEAGDVATAVESTLAEHRFLDAERVAVYGGSFGGYAAAWQLVQFPELYAAGGVAVGMTELVDMYENTVPQFRNGFLRRHLGRPDEHPDRYRERSPITHAENVDVPVLLVHGREDPRVPVSQARRFRDALVDAGRSVGEGGDVEYHELAGSGHWSGDGGVPEPLSLFADFLGRRL